MDAGGTAFWLPVGEHAVAAVLHRPPGPSLSTGVLLLPPFGWEETASHRSVRRWADELALEGHPTLRLDWPCTGDSSGAGSQPGQWDAWTQTVDAAAECLRQRTGCARVTAVGLGLGGLVALAAAHDGAAVDDLVLWGAPARGRAALRQLQATAALLGEGPAQREQDGLLWVYGYPMPADMQRQLAELVVERMDLRRPGRRILVLDRGTDAALALALSVPGIGLEVAPGAGYDHFVEHPQESLLPEPVVRRVSQWLGREAVAASDLHLPDLPDLPDAVRLPGTSVQERLVELPSRAGLLRCVISEPVSGPRATLTTVLLNSGATRRTGPNRMWVDAARAWAQKGVTVVRLDLAPLGDSGGHQPSPRPNEGYYADSLLEQVHDALDELARLGLPARVLLAGMCSSAYMSWQLAVRDPRVVGAVLLNPAFLHYSRRLLVTRASQDLRKLRVSSTWLKLVTGRLSRRHVVAVIQATATRAAQASAYRRATRHSRAAVAADVRRLVDASSRVAIVLGPQEELLRELQASEHLDALEHHPYVTVHLLAGAHSDHMFLAGALRAQACEILDDVVAELSRHEQPVALV